jgi:putative RecB family exonuclease
MGVYSHSKLSSFEQCPYKFKLRYIDKIIPEVEKSIEAHLGTSVHETLEWIYLEVIKVKRVPTLDEVIVFYSNRWQDGFSEDILIVKENMSAKDYFNMGVRFLIDYYTHHQPFQDGTLELEKQIIIELGEHKIRGFIDRLSKNPETGEIEIHDYKTGNFLPKQEKFDKDRQLALYSIAIKELFGENQEVCLVWHYLAHNKKICSRRTNEQLNELKKETLELIKKIESATEFPTSKCVLCDWCEYKGICPEFNKSVQEEDNIDNYQTIKKYLKK